MPSLSYAPELDLCRSQQTLLQVKVPSWRPWDPAVCRVPPTVTQLERRSSRINAFQRSSSSVVLANAGNLTGSARFLTTT
jgi:hypothetical protein